MKRIVLAAALALGVLAVTGSQASAAGFGNGGGTYGISPGSFSIGIGLNVAWSGFSVGQMAPGGGGGPCYGQGGCSSPQMYNAYGYGGYADGYSGYYGGYYGGYPAYGYGNGYSNGYPGYTAGNAPANKQQTNTAAQPNGHGK